MSITIDSTTYDVPFVSITRRSDVLDKYAERTEDGVLHREIIGVYYNFDVVMGMSKNNATDYASLYVKLTEPEAFHEVTMPAESGYETFQAYFANVRDEAVKWDGASVRFFRNLSFSVIAQSPARTP